MEYLLIPSLLAIGIKVCIFLRYHASLRRENIDLGIFFVAVFFLNVFELLSIKADFAPQSSLLILLAYYCCVIFTIHGFLNLALTYSGFDLHTGRIKMALNGILALLIVGMIFSRGIIAGVEPMSGYTLTRVPGPYYWVFQVYLLGGLLAGMALLYAGRKLAASNIDRQKCLVVLISSFTPVLMACGVVALMATGLNINGVIFMSLSLSLMLGLMVYAEEKTRLFRLLTFMPFTRERALHKELLQRITGCVAISDDPQSGSLNLKQMMKELEGSVVEHVLDYYGGNQKKAAGALGVSEATISRRARVVRDRVQPTVSVRMTENATSS